MSYIARTDITKYKTIQTRKRENQQTHLFTMNENKYDRQQPTITMEFKAFDLGHALEYTRIKHVCELLNLSQFF